MATFLTDEKAISDLYNEAEQESNIWRKDYHEYERLADNDLLPDLDENLPETNDGTLAASLYKLPKRIINSNLKGRVVSKDRDEAWITELANMQWENVIIPNANSQAPFHRKWKDAVRKAAIYGSVPLITLFVERGDYIGSDFIVAQPQDVLLEPGKVSDYDSDVMFWEVYFSELQVKDMIERAKRENKEKGDGYNKWDIPALEAILDGKMKEERPYNQDHNQASEGVRKSGIKFCVVVQRGVNAPFYMYHKGTKKTVREWSNPDPTGDVPIHFLYCYQDFINPYGVGIVKLAGGTQNVLDVMRKYDVLATQLGLRPPVSIAGNTDNTDLDSIVYAEDAQWMIGDAVVKREQIATEVYSQLPNRISMYKISLNQMIPTGDTSIASGAGDQDYSKTPAGVDFQKQNLSIDDEDFKDNLYMTYEAKARSMINTQFANMQGTDIMKLSDDERDILIKAGMDWPTDENGELIETNELEILWDEARTTVDFEVDAEQDKAKNDEKRLEAQLKVLEIVRSDPMLPQDLMADGKKLNKGELLAEIIKLTSDNDKILEDIGPEDQAAMDAQIDPTTGQPLQDPNMQQEQPQEQVAEQPEQQDPESGIIQALMERYGVSEGTASAMRMAEKQGFEPEEILAAAGRAHEQEAVHA